MENSFDNSINFYFPAGGGSLDSPADVIQYFKDFGYTVSCREHPSFRAGLFKGNQYGNTYHLVMFDNISDEKPSLELPIGQRITKKKAELVYLLMIGYIHKNY